MSYVNNKIDQLKEYIDIKISNSNGGGNNSNEIVVVELAKGEYLIGKAGTEFILRGGKSTAYGVEVDRGLQIQLKGKILIIQKTYYLIII